MALTLNKQFKDIRDFEVTEDDEKAEYIQI